MAKLTKKHIFKCMLEDKPIELWLPTANSDDPVNIASHKLMLETGIYVHCVNDAQSDVRLRVTYPIRVYWPRTAKNHFSDDEFCVVVGADNSMTEYNIRNIEIDETIPLEGDEERANAQIN